MLEDVHERLGVEVLDLVGSGPQLTISENGGHGWKTVDNVETTSKLRYYRYRKMAIVLVSQISGMAPTTA